MGSSFYDSPTCNKPLMKTIFITLMLLCGFVSPLLASDPIVVNKLIHKITDLSALNAPKDMNGTPCGLLKVITDDKSMTFEGSVIGIPEYKNGEYWVYIPEGTYQIQIKASPKEPVLLNFRDYNLQSCAFQINLRTFIQTAARCVKHIPYQRIFRAKCRAVKLCSQILPAI